MLHLLPVFVSCRLTQGLQITHWKICSFTLTLVTERELLAALFLSFERNLQKVRQVNKENIYIFWNQSETIAVDYW